MVDITFSDIGDRPLGVEFLEIGTLMGSLNGTPGPFRELLWVSLAVESFKRRERNGVQSRPNLVEMPRKSSIHTPLRPEHREYAEYVRYVLEHLDDPDPDA